MRTRSSVLVTCHLEPPGRALLEETQQHVPDILIVSDGMPSEAEDALLVLARELQVETLLLRPNRGKGSAVRAGLAHVLRRAEPPEAVLVLDGDGQHPPDAIPRFLERALEAELVIGDRFRDPAAMPRHRQVANRLATRLLALSTGGDVRDSQCGMRLLRGRALHTIPFPAGRYEAESVHLKRCLRAGIGIAWEPLPAVYGDESSSFRSVRDGLRVLLAIVR